MLEVIERLDIGRIVCLGDIVGYGADPSGCVDLVRRFCSRGIIGNHDAGAVDLTPVDCFNPAAREAVLWTGRALSDEDRSYLQNLPYEMDIEDFRIVHSTPDDPARWSYLLIKEEAGPLFDFFSARLLFYGHTHVPVVFRQEAGGAVYEQPAVRPSEHVSTFSSQTTYARWLSTVSAGLSWLYAHPSWPEMISGVFQEPPLRFTTAGRQR